MLGRIAPKCAYWSEIGGEWREEGLMVASVNAGSEETSEFACWTFHLSLFAVQEQEVSSQWVNIDQLTDTDVLLEVSRRFAAGVRDLPDGNQRCET